MKNLTLRLALLVPVLGLSGCVSTRYKLAEPTTTPPAVALRLSSTPEQDTIAESAIEAPVNTVIVFQGPGSWKREAYWDEYVVTIANLGPTPFTVESAELSGFANTPMNPGDSPWAVEKQSRTLAEKGFGLAKNTALQIGGGIGAIYLGGAVGVALSSGGWAAVGGAIAGGMVGLPLFVGSSIYRNISSRHAIEREFDRRHLALPANLVPGHTVAGSLFFPITPGPQRLLLRGRAGDQPCEVTIDLTSLGGLHLKKQPTTSAFGEQLRSSEHARQRTTRLEQL